MPSKIVALIKSQKKIYLIAIVTSQTQVVVKPSLSKCPDRNAIFLSFAPTILLDTAAPELRSVFVIALSYAPISFAPPSLSLKWIFLFTDCTWFEDFADPLQKHYWQDMR